MRLTAIITKDDLEGLVRGLTPMRVDLGPGRTVSFGAPEIVELVAARGLRVRGDARLLWEIAGLPLPVSLRAWQILLEPSVVVRDGALVLAFDPVLEALDFKRVPGFFDERIILAINEIVATQKKKLAWNVSRALSWHRPLPQRVSPARTFDIAPSSASVSVSSEELRVEMTFAAQVAAAAPPASLRSA